MDSTGGEKRGTRGKGGARMTRGVGGILGELDGGKWNGTVER